jgi:hypothetical protein
VRDHLHENIYYIILVVSDTQSKNNRKREIIDMKYYENSDNSFSFVV